MRLQIAENGGNLSEPEECLVKAITLDPNSIEALYEAAHFYEAVVPDAIKARKYATACREKATQILAEMDGILASL